MTLNPTFMLTWMMWWMSPAFWRMCPVATPGTWHSRSRSRSRCQCQSRCRSRGQEGAMQNNFKCRHFAAIASRSIIRACSFCCFYTAATPAYAHCQSTWTRGQDIWQWCAILPDARQLQFVNDSRIKTKRKTEIRIDTTKNEQRGVYVIFLCALIRRAAADIVNPCHCILIRFSEF